MWSADCERDFDAGRTGVTSHLNGATPMWIDPMVKWRADPAREALLTGDPDVARQEFERAFELRGEARDLAGLGDALMLLGDQDAAVACFQRAEGDPDPLVELGLSQALVLAGDAWQAIRLLERLLTDRPDDPAVRHHLAGALLSAADLARSVTRDEEFVITARRQLEMCSYVAQRVTVVAVDDTHREAARALAELTEDGQEWIWSRENAAIAYGALVVILGLAAVVLGGMTGNVLLVVAGAVLGAAAVFAIVVTHRRQAWQVRADRVAPLVWRHGLTD
jgi:tetratricopeptide (TPR) repeat protein